MGLGAVNLVRSVDADLLCEASPVNLGAGGEPGLSCAWIALERGMHVVTPNKGPIVLAYRELVGLAKEKAFRSASTGPWPGDSPPCTLGCATCAERRSRGSRRSPTS